MKRTISRVPIEKQKAIAEQFWAMKTAEQCAEEVAINRKTAQKHYSKLRDKIAELNILALKRISSLERLKTRHPDTNKYPVFWSLAHEQKIFVLFPTGSTAEFFSFPQDEMQDIQGISEIFTTSPTARKNTILDKFFRRTLWTRNDTDEWLLKEFWRQAKLNLMNYRGGCKSRFPLFITEMAFRFNHREIEDAIHLLDHSMGGPSSKPKQQNLGGKRK